MSFARTNSLLAFTGLKSVFSVGLITFVDLFKINFIIIFKNEDYVKIQNIYNQEMKLDAKKYCCGFLNESRVTSHESPVMTQHFKKIKSHFDAQNNQAPR